MLKSTNIDNHINYKVWQLQLLEFPRLQFEEYTEYTTNRRSLKLSIDGEKLFGSGGAVAIQPNCDPL